MKKFYSLILFMLFSTNIVLAENVDLKTINPIQSKINCIGTNILNSNKIEKRVVFVYNDKAKANILDSNKSITKRQVLVFSDTYKNAENDDELAAYIAREIPAAVRSYDGLGDGWLSSIKMKAAPKKYELIFDKLAVDYMVKAGYNPLALITYINKTYPQARQDKISNKNLTSKRLAYIYERIYSKYPVFLAQNDFITNKYYQNFLLTSQHNRGIVAQKVENPKESKGLKYE